MAELHPIADVERDLKRQIPGNNVRLYFPAVNRNGGFLKVSPYANYVFVSSALPDPKLLRIEDSRFVDAVLCIPGSAGRWRTISKLTDEDLRNATGSARNFDGLEQDSTVVVTSGPFEGLEGTVESIFGDKLKINVGLRSRSRIVNVSREDVKLK